MGAVDDNDFLVYAEDVVDPLIPAHEVSPWKILVVDDESSVHELTRLALKDFRFEGRKLLTLSAYSGIEAKELATQNPDAAMMLLDVVMEDEFAGLTVVKFIRETLKNRRLRIVLRTGQPGSAPEQEIISNYDINDYKEKTELTSRKLFTLMHACLRGYRDLCIIEENKRGLEQIIESSADLFRTQSLDQLTSGVLRQLDNLLNLRGGFFARANSVTTAVSGGLALVRHSDETINVVAATGTFSNCVGQRAIDLLPSDAHERLSIALKSGQGQYWDDKYIGIFQTPNTADRIVFLTGVQPMGDFDHHLIQLFSRTVGISFENLHLREEIEETQRELVYRLGGAVETRSKETGSHVRRVAEMSRQLALLAGLGMHDATILKHASPMHDVGKIGISDAILNKPGKLTGAEWLVMKTHTIIGYELFAGSDREILRLGGLISLEHHEKWDGSGYPLGKKREDIHITGRITALVDVFDALLSKRVYKNAWTFDSVVTLLRQESGTHFDPRLVELMLANLPMFVAIRDLYSDDVEDAVLAPISVPVAH
jgi:response regulator RpfG family c-di-GMP phosphodiesterase